MTKTKDLDELDPQPGFHLFGGEDKNDKDNYIDPAPIKWLTGHKHMVELSTDFNEHAQVKRWCEQNCKDVVAYKITNSYNYGHDPTDKIYFFSETDAVAFKLRWL